MNGHYTTAQLQHLPSVSAACCGAVERQYYLDFDDSRDDPPRRLGFWKDPSLQE